MKQIPHTKITIPNKESIYTPYLGPVDTRDMTAIHFRQLQAASDFSRLA